MKTSGLKIRHVCIYNPISSERFPYAAEIESIDVRFSFISMLLAKKIEISDLLIRGANLTIFPYDNHGTKTNWSLVWKNFSTQQEPITNSWLDQTPVLIRRCVFINTRVHGTRANQKDVPPLSVPSLEFYSIVNASQGLPKFSTALPLLLYLAVEESLYHLNLPGDIIKRISQQAHEYFYSAYPGFQNYLNESNNPRKSTEELMGFVRELFFH
ncbi:hypothetical protein Cs308_0742 [Candidatus Chlamydia sanziniae]|uniref:Uncharacterized protein n=1 Tax=Candidatus Chlamydia sanziniae TaxID=1806891 RepID=A0A1A9HXU8_9CHLA|nr:hypothetical protein Cs308_0742 [Candidatus Chlamydia sanziniae]